MPRFELSIKASYLPGWDIYAGCRELIQNARDAEIQDDAKMTVEHVYRIRDKRPVGAIIITNEGTTLPRESFLIGHTSKEGRDDLIGKFGEGFKFGILALLRQGLTVKIRNGAETWDPLICRSEKFNAEVLAFDVKGGNKFENRVQIEVLGIELDEWEKMKKKFLFLNPLNEREFHELPSGRILLSEEHKGSIFVKGMFVCKSHDSRYGYDVNVADIDRDRRMISDKGTVTARLLTDAINLGLLQESMYDMLKVGAEDTNNAYAYMMSDEARQYLAKQFRDEYGPEAYPVDNEALAAELGHLGMRGVKVPYVLLTVLERVFGSTAQAIKNLKMNARHVYSFDELSFEEKTRFDLAQVMLRRAMVVSGMNTDIVNNICIVDFADNNLLGTFNRDDGSIRLSKKTLSSTASALRILIHEAAHVSGGDGTKGHEEAIGNLTEAVFTQLMGC